MPLCLILIGFVLQLRPKLQRLIFFKISFTTFRRDIEFLFHQGEEEYLKNSFKSQPERWDYEDFEIDIKKDRDFLEELTNTYYDRLLGYLLNEIMDPYLSYSYHKSKSDL